MPLKRSKVGWRRKRALVKPCNIIPVLWTVWGKEKQILNPLGVIGIPVCIPAAGLTTARTLERVKGKRMLERMQAHPCISKPEKSKDETAPSFYAQANMC